MTGSQSDGLLHAADEDDEWEYREPTSSSAKIENVDNTELKKPRVAISKYIPLIEHDSEEGVIRFTTKLR